MLLTHMTATGRAAGAALYGDRVVQAWLPYDVPFAVRAFLAHFAPRAGLLMETEVWPNLDRMRARAARVPLFLVNARLSERSLRGYRRFASLTQPMFAALAGVAAQTDADAARLRERRRARRRGHRQPEVRRRESDAGVRALGRALRETLRRRAAGLGRRVDARRRGGAAPRRARARRAAGATR